MTAAEVLGRVVIDDGCWEWNGPHGEGYGFAYLNRRGTKAYRAIYEILVGPIPEGLELDHLCRNRGCVRPDHLEPVTRRENILRGEGACAKHARKTHCKRGHEFTEENTWISIDSRGRRGRHCRICQRMHGARYRAEAKAKAA